MNNKNIDNCMRCSIGNKENNICSSLAHKRNCVVGVYKFKIKGIVWGEFEGRYSQYGYGQTYTYYKWYKRIWLTMLGKLAQIATWLCK